MSTKLNHVQDWLELAKQVNWSVTKLAKLCGVSVRMLERYFLKTFGQSPKSWLTAERHKQAMEFLKRHCSVKQTAWLLGYAHASTFAREFKKHTGQCPHNPAKLPAQTGSAQQIVE